MSVRSLRRGIIAGSGAAPAPSCTITLEAPGAVGDAFGAQPLDVDGQTISKTLVDSSTDSFAAGSPSDSIITIDWAGRRAIEFGENDAADFGDMERGFMKTDFSPTASWKWGDSDGHWAIICDGGIQKDVAGLPTDIVGIVIGGNGDVEFWREGVLEYTGVGSLSAGTEIWFYNAANTTGLSIPAGATTATTVRAGKDAQSYDYDGADDWCGNQL